MAVITDVFTGLSGYAALGLGSFVLCFIAVAIAEAVWPARCETTGGQRRLGINFGLGVINLALIALIPISSFAGAMLAAERGWGLLHPIAAPLWLSLACLLAARSLLDYWLHRAFHRVPLLWPLHAVHHRDDVIDLSTSFRTQPLQYLITSAAIFALVLALGPSVLAALLTDIVLMAAAMLQHANVRLPDRVSDRLEPWLITPRLHLVHHARDRALHDSNYGDLFSVWDRLFGTFRAAPAEPFAIGAARPGKAADRPDPAAAN